MCVTNCTVERRGVVSGVGSECVQGGVGCESCGGWTCVCNTIFVT